MLPYSAYPAVHTSEPRRKAGARSRSAPRAWSWPLLAALATLIVAVGVFLVLWPYLNRKPAAPEADAPPVREELDRLTAQGQRALADGSFALAREKFQTAVNLRNDQPDLLDTAATRRLHQLFWQGDLLARELKPALTQLLKEANSHDTDAGWQAQFDLDYRGKAVIFDDVVQIPAFGGPSHLQGAEIHWLRVRGRVAVDDLKLLKALPGNTSLRWIFGARLASFTPAADGWVIRFAPDSGTLLTDLDAVKAWKPALRNDPDLPAVLHRQQEQLRQMLVPEP